MTCAAGGFWRWAGTYAIEVVAGVLAVEVASAVGDVADSGELGGLLGVCEEGEHLYSGGETPGSDPTKCQGGLKVPKIASSLVPS